MSVKFIVIFLLILVFYSSQLVDGKGGRGGGGGRSSGFRSGGSRSFSRSTRFSSRTSSSRLFRSSSSRAYVTRRYSYQWKSRAYSHHYIYVHHHSWSYRRRDNYEEWNVCFNLIFSGLNNTPIVQITTHESLREMDDSVYEEALDRVLNFSLKLTKENVTQDLFPTEETEYSQPWQYLGLFICPLFPQDSGFKYCCGPDEFQYCCSYWEMANIQGVIWGVVVCLVIIGFLVLKGKKGFRWVKKKVKTSQSFETVATHEINETSSNKNIDNTNDSGFPENNQSICNNSGGLGMEMNAMLQNENPENRHSAVPIGFMGIEGELNNIHGNINPPSWPPVSQTNDPPHYPSAPPPSYEFATQSKA